MLNLKKGQGIIFLVHLAFLIIYSYIFISRRNYEFIGYIGVILLFLIIILATNNKLNYPNFVLWGLTLWSFMHLSGGGVIVNGAILYKYMIFDIVGEPYLIFKYDQLAHLVGFFVGTLVMFYLLKPKLKPIKNWTALSIVILMAGLGLGALNEIIEFMATVLVPETNVGGYINTALDLVFDLLGGVIALAYIYFKERKSLKNG